MNFVVQHFGRRFQYVTSPPSVCRCATFASKAAESARTARTIKAWTSRSAVKRWTDDDGRWQAMAVMAMAVVELGVTTTAAGPRVECVGLSSCFARRRFVAHAGIVGRCGCPDVRSRYSASDSHHDTVTLADTEIIHTLTDVTFSNRLRGLTID